MQKKVSKEILIIDDDIDTQNFLKKILETAGFRCSQALNVSEGLNLLTEVAPHLVLLDFKLQEDDGFKIIREMRSLSAFKQTPIVMMSATQTKKLIMRSIEAGANEFMAKPLQPHLLLQRIKKLLKDYELPILNLPLGHKVRAKSVGELIKINEMGVILQSTIKLAKPARLEVESDFLKSLGASPCLTEISTEAVVANPGIYRNEVRFRGMDEKTAKKIRNIRN